MEQVIEHFEYLSVVPSGRLNSERTAMQKARFANIPSIENVLLFDDDPIFLKIAKRFADKRHLPMTAVESFEDFKQQWSRSKPDLVILDFDLELGLLGPQIARLLGDTPVILISRKARHMDEGAHWSDNIQSFFHKKYGLPRLIGEVHAVLGVKAHRDILGYSNVYRLDDYRSKKRRTRP